MAALLLCVGGGAGAYAWSVDRQMSQAAATSLALEARLDGLFERVASLTTAQAGYVMPGADTGHWLQRVPALLRESSGTTAAIGADLRSPATARAMQDFADATARLAQADAQARDHLLLGDTLTASRVLFGDAREALETMRASLSDVRVAERRAVADERASAARSTLALLGLAGLFCAAGVLLLVPIPAPRAREAGQRAGAPGAAPAHVDLAVAADLCTRIARLETTDGLERLLDRAAAILDARGIIVWASAGEQLVPVVASGYEARIVARLGPVPVRGDNATAAAWRLQQMQVVEGHGESPGAIAAPICGPGGCAGVLALEVPQSRLGEPVTRAVVTMIAAQMASVVSGWRGTGATSGRPRAAGLGPV